MGRGLTLTKLCCYGQRLYLCKGKGDFDVYEGTICSSGPLPTGPHLGLTDMPQGPGRHYSHSTGEY